MSTFSFWKVTTYHRTGQYHYQLPSTNYQLSSRRPERPTEEDRRGPLAAADRAKRPSTSPVGRKRVRSTTCNSLNRPAVPKISSRIFRDSRNQLPTTNYQLPTHSLPLKARRRTIDHKRYIPGHHCTQDHARQDLSAPNRWWRSPEDDAWR